jgi:hypothetical protein
MWLIVPYVLYVSWEKRTDPHGRAYYVDHMAGLTTWERPLPSG